MSDSISYHLLAHRGSGRTHDAVMGMKLGLGDKIYVCGTISHAMDIRKGYDVKTISIGELEKLRGLTTTPIFDHYALGVHISNLEEKNRKLNKENQRLKEKLQWVEDVIKGE